jgi:cytochrome P450
MTRLDDLPTLERSSITCPHALRAAVIAAQQESPLARVGEGTNFVWVLRQHDVRAVLRDPRVRSMGTAPFKAAGITDGPLIDYATASLLRTDGEVHSRLRRLLASAFTPGSADRLRPFARATFAGLLDAVFDQGGCDAATALCDPYPTPVICQLIGFEADRWEDISEWSAQIMMSFRTDLHVVRPIVEDGFVKVFALVAEMIEARRECQRDDLISRLIELERSTDRLTEHELQALVAQMLVAGTDTTRGQLSLIIEVLARRPEVWAELRADPNLVPKAVEEAIRIAPTAAVAARLTTEEMEIGGTVVPAGTVLFLNTLAANVDGEVLAHADQFDLHRELPTGWHLHTFGGGVHYCLGANLARLELVEAVHELVDRCATLELAGEPTPPTDGSPLLRYRSLPIRWT